LSHKGHNASQMFKHHNSLVDCFIDLRLSVNIHHAIDRTILWMNIISSCIPQTEIWRILR